MKKTMGNLMFVCLILLACTLMFIACDNTSTQQTDKKSTSDAHVHSFNAWSVSIDATCTDEGVQKRNCSCGQEETKSIAILPHKFGEWTTIKESTCTENGEQKRICACGAEESKIMDILSHHFGDWTTIKEATCTENGEQKRTCVCNQTETKTLPSGHSYTNNICTKCNTPKPSEGLKFKKIGNEYTVSGLGSCTDKHIVIPSTYNNLPVTTLDNLAFFQENIVSVIIPDSVTEIGFGAFDHCTRLERVVFGKNTKIIDEFAFNSCYNLTEINIPDTVTVIGNRAFYGCSSIERVVIPGGVKKIGESAFSNCSNLSEIKISNGVQEIGYEAFYECRTLTTVILPDSLTTIDSSAFCECSRLHTIYLGNGLTFIASTAFSDCDQLTRVYYNGSKNDWKTILNEDYTISKATIIYNTVQPKVEDIT